MKILQIVPMINPSRGGREKHVIALSNQLAALGHEVTVIASDSFSETTKFEYCKIPLHNVGHILNIPSLSHMLQIMKEREFDICHIHYSAIYSEIALIAAQIFKIPAIVTFHTEIKRGLIKLFYDRLTLYIVNKLADCIIFLTEGMRTTLTDRGITNAKSVVIPNGIYVSSFIREHQAVRHRIHKIEPFDLLFVGRIEKRKGVEYLIHALSILRQRGLNLKLVIVGDGPYLSKLMKLTRKEGLSSYIRFTGYVPRKKLIAYYLSSTVVVIPSLDEGLPTVGFEAMLSGKPVIATNIPGMADIIFQDVNGLLVRPRDSIALANAIETIISDAEKIKDYGDKGKNLAFKFDWSLIKTEIVSLYERMVNHDK